MKSSLSIVVVAALATACAQTPPETQLVRDAAEALGGTDRIQAVRTLVVEGGGAAPNVGQNRLPDDELPEAREQIGRSYDRAYDPAASSRQMVALLARPRRIEALGSVRAPTVVIHGSRDTIVAPAGARETARAIPGARLCMIDGMRHGIPRALWPSLVETIVSNARRAS